MVGGGSIVFFAVSPRGASTRRAQILPMATENVPCPDLARNGRVTRHNRRVRANETTSEIADSRDGSDPNFARNQANEALMTTITQELRQATEQAGGQPLRLEDQHTRQAYVPINADVFSRRQELFAEQDRQAAENMFPATQESFQDGNDPAMDADSDLDSRRGKGRSPKRSRYFLQTIAHAFSSQTSIFWCPTATSLPSAASSTKS
jgi:hypothetical protein